MNSLKKQILLPGLIFLSTLLMVGCKKLELDKIAQSAWNPNLAVPLAHANFGVYDILALQDSNDIVVMDPITGAIALMYNGEIVSYDAQSIVQLQNQNEQVNLSLAELNVPALPAFNGSATATNSEDIDFSTNAGVQLHQIMFKGGALSASVSTTLKHDVSIVISFPGLTINGTAVTRTVNLTYTGNTPQTGSVSVDLTNVLADFTLGNTTFNRFKINMQTTITGTGQEVAGTEDIDLNFGFTNLAFENARGYFGQQNLGISNDSILLRLFESATVGHFELINPKVRFIVDNSFGFPVRINFAEMKTINAGTGQEYPLTGFPSQLNINYPAVMGQSANTVLELNTSNTANLSTIISPVPKFFYFEASATSNPNGMPATLNFIEDDSKFRVRTEIELPLEGLAYGFELKDTVEFNFSENVSNIESVMFRVNIDNGFPVDFLTQIQCMDQNYQPLFNLMASPQNLVQSALVDNAGKVNKRTKKITDISLTPAQIAQLPNVKYLLINGVAQTLNGTSGQIVKFYDSYKLGLKLGMQVQGNVGF